MPYAGNSNTDTDRYSLRDAAGRFRRRPTFVPPSLGVAHTWIREAAIAAAPTNPHLATTAATTQERSFLPPTPRATAQVTPPPNRTSRPAPRRTYRCYRGGCDEQSINQEDFVIDHYGNDVCTVCAENQEYYFVCDSCDDLYPADNYAEEGVCYGCNENQDEDEFYCDGCATTFSTGDCVIRECPPNYGGEYNLLCDECYRTSIPLSIRATHEMRNINRLNPRPSIPMSNRELPRTYPEDKKDIRSRILIRCPFGIEIETTNGGNKSLEVQSLTGFSGITDGSIRSHDSGGGLEFVSPVFLDDSGLKQIEKLCGLGLESNDSCGLHLHLDSRDWDWLMLRKFMTLAKMVEPEVLEIMPHQRNNGGYCSLLRFDADEILDCENKHEFLAVMLNLNSSQFDRYMQQKGNKVYAMGRETVVIGGTNVSRRYEWVNVMSYFFRGSVEIRIHDGTTDYETIKNWVLLWQAVVYWLKTHTLADLESMSSLWDIPNDKIVSFYEERRKRLCADYLAQSASTTSES